MAEPAWWETLFSGPFLEALRSMYSDSQTQAEADFLVKTLAPAAGAKILDVPCGGGRLSLALAARGFTVTGVDLTAELIDDATKAAAERRLFVEFHQRDMRDLPWCEEFDHAFCMGNSFGYFARDENSRFLKAVARTLKQGGSLMLETHFAAEALFSQNLGRRWYPFGDLIFLHDTQYDPLITQLRSEYAIVANGTIQRSYALYQIYTAKQIVDELKCAGFTTVTLFGGLDLSSLRIGSAGLWALATK